MKLPQAVIFDMDGVLVDTYHAHYRSWLRMAEPAGLAFTEAEFAPTFGRTSREVIGTFWVAGRFTAAEIAALDDQKEAAFREIIAVDFPAMPGVHGPLHSLRRAGFALGIGSSAPPANVDVVLEKLDVRGLFGAVVTGSDLTRGKADPQVFLLAAGRLGDSAGPLRSCPDAPPGVAAAKAAGMTAVGLASTGRTPPVPGRRRHGRRRPGRVDARADPRSHRIGIRRG